MGVNVPPRGIISKEDEQDPALKATPVSILAKWHFKGL